MSQPTDPRPHGSHHYDAVIVGAGLIGSSVAAHLSELKPSAKILVLDPDLSGFFSSSERNAGGVRATWWQPINIQVGLHALDYFGKHRSEVGYHDCGYTFLYTPEKWKKVQTHLEEQRSLGVEIEVFKRTEILKRFPFLGHDEEIEAATFSKKDGLVNPNQLKEHFRSVAKKNGVIFQGKTLVRAIDRSESTLKIDTCSWEKLSEDETKLLLSPEFKTDAFDGFFARSDLKDLESRATKQLIHADRLINCAGAWAPLISHLYGETIQARPIRRQISVVHCQDFKMNQYGMVVDTSGLYFHPEAENLMVGWADENEPAGYRLDYDGDDFFMNDIWPRLWHRVPKTESLRHLDGWAGLYGQSQDSSAIVGQTTSHPHIYEAHSFSGRGAMQSPAIGHALVELITHGRYQSLDLSPLSRKRFENNQLLHEGLVI